MDAWVGRLLDTLEATGKADNTWIVVLGDHGVLLGEHGWMGKPPSRVHREVYRVPCMIRHPRGRKGGRRSGYYASTHDVAPTVLGAAGLRVPRKMDGTDLTRLFRGKKPAERNYFTAGFSNWVVAGNDDWVLISDNQLEKPRLYNRRKDPRELRDVASSNPGQVRKLYGKLKKAAGGPLPRLK